MRWLRLLAVGGLIVLCATISAPSVSAVSLRITPLQYKTTLKSGEKLQGYVDIANPESNAVDVTFEVQAFRQIDDEGGIEFYDDEAISEGVMLDLQSVELGPREALRLMFLLDGTKLPQGEVFAAILARTMPHDAQGSAQAVRVGTILEITNGIAGAHKASIEGLSASFLQVGEGLSARFVVRSDDKGSQTTGFRPKVTVSIAPYSTREVDGPLVFAGHSRAVDYKESGNYFGFMRIQASVDGIAKGQLIFAMTGYWRWLGPLMILSILSLISMAVYTRRKKH